MSDDRAQAALPFSPSAVVLLNAELRCVHAHGQLAGRQGDELLGNGFLGVLPSDCHPRLRAACAQVRESGARGAFECRRDSEVLSFHLVPLKGDSALVLVVPADATGSVHEKRQRDNRLRYAVEASGVGTWSWDRQTDTIAWDAGLCRIYGLHTDQSPRVYDDYVRYLHPEDRPRIEAQIGRCLETGVYEDFEHRLIRPDGAVRHVFCRGAAERDERGDVIGMSGGIFDITDRKRIEEHLRQVQKMEAFGQLAAGIAHNFNNLLSVVLPNAELCRLHAPTSLQDAIADIEHAAGRASEMVRQLMLFARHEASEAKVPVDLGALVQRTQRICRSTFDRRITIEHFVEDELPTVLARAGELEQVLLNICINARDALEAAYNTDPRIVLRVQRANDVVRVTVSDNGPGMDEATRGRLFEPFFTTKEIGRGTGLGLASAYGIVLDHKGTISCKSALGQGATFVIELPPTSAEAIPAPIPTLVKDRGGDETLLLVDDEPLVRRALGSLLRDAGFQVVEAGDGLEALAKLEGAQLILLDRSMPNMSGDEFLKELRLRTPNLPVILLTGFPGSEVEVDGLFTIVTKPPRRALLLSTIRQMLDRRKFP